MIEKGFRQRLAERQKEVRSLVCVGFDPLDEKLPECLRTDLHESHISTDVVTWMEDVSDATAEYASMFKPQKAHWEAFTNGAWALQKLITHMKHKHPRVPIFEDCKRGDIKRTQTCYRVGQFQIDGTQGMNFSPYMGKECMEALFDKNHPERSIVSLCYTSNPSAREMQDVILQDGRRYWEFVAEAVLRWANELGITENVGLVMAAAYELPPKGSGNVYSWHLKRCREIVGDLLWFLIPGIGTQKGAVLETVQYAYAGPGSMAINSSSEIDFASSKEDYAEAAGIRAMLLRDEINMAMDTFDYTYDLAA